MTRPVYETPEDLAREAALAKIVARAAGRTLVKLPRRYVVDWMLMHDRRVDSFIEAKCRTTPRDKYDSYMLSLWKYQHAKQLRELTGLHVWLVVRWTDHIGRVCLTRPNLPAQLTVGGRQDRGDPEDQEPVVLINVEEFSFELDVDMPAAPTFTGGGTGP